ncbi:MAG: sigma-54-dependent Fis family transcriptional regulator [Gammaproteobacteria bacterium]|nr:sigma-54-dependent Fis family transcriptional regulator [Gammaproteobacteria bacterium]
MSDKRPHILFVDDDPRAGELMLRFSEGADYRCSVYQDPVEALDAYKRDGAAMIVSDLSMPQMSGTELLAQVRALDSEIPFVIITGYSSVDNAIEALRLGANDFIKKPFDMDELRLLIEKTLSHEKMVQENRLLKRQIKDEQQRYQMTGSAPAIRQVYKIIDKIADVRCNVIIEGESGTGKELAARAIHRQSQFADRPFIVIDCGAITDTLLESELFGHEKGAFTGAMQAKRGLLETASGGSVFLDEIGNISDAMQTKLLRVVQEQQVVRVGGVTPIDIDVRFIVATNQDLEKMVEQGNFRADLYHRLNVVKIRMPALAERREDIPALVQNFINEFAERYHRDVSGFDAESMQKLMQYDWPGNIRELRNLVERYVALAEASELTLEETLYVPEQRSDMFSDAPSMVELERRYIMFLLDKYDGNREQMASTLGINKSTLWRKLKQYGVIA